MISLEIFLPEDFARLKSWISSKEGLLQFAGTNFTFPLTDEQLARHIAEPKRKVYKIILNSTNACIGHGEIYMDAIPRLGRILIANEENRNRGYGKLIIKQLMQICFSEANVMSIDLNVYDWNHRAISCYEKMGFKINSEISSSIEVNGKTWVALNMVYQKLD
jgi:RimJ/RimL family protein N-acetyltransferase